MCGPHFCSMQITEDVRKYAAEHGLSETEALESGLQEKKKEFLEKGARFTPRRNVWGAHAPRVLAMAPSPSPTLKS